VQVFSLQSNNDFSFRTWEQLGQDIIGELIIDKFGWAVALTEYAKTLTTGAFGNNGKERNWVM
jgi:hypothetical protein